MPCCNRPEREIAIVSIVERATRIILQPHAEWPAIAAEPATPAGLFSRYIAPLATIGPIALVIGLSLVGASIPFAGTYRAPLSASLTQAIFMFVTVLAGVSIASAIASFLAPSFGGRRDSLAALKLVGYSYTPSAFAGILGLVPQLGALELFAALWALYVFACGAPALGLSAREKAIPFTAACVGCGIVASLVCTVVAGATGATAGIFTRHDAIAISAHDNETRSIAAGILGAAMGGGDANTEHAHNVIKDVAAAENDEQNAERSGDTDAQLQAGMKMLGSIVHGGAPPVRPIAHDALESLLPKTIAGRSRNAAGSSSASLAGISASSAHATYGRTDGPHIDVTVSDLGNMSGLAAAANLATTMQAESDGDSGYEKNIDVDGHRVHEKWTKAVKRSDLMEIVDNRYAVSVDGTGVEMEAAVAAVRGIDMVRFQELGAAK